MPKTQDIINFIDNNWELSNGFWVIFVFLKLYFKLNNAYSLRLLEKIKINVTSRLADIVIFKTTNIFQAENINL
jgi:hypothetical protein